MTRHNAEIKNTIHATFFLGIFFILLFLFIFKKNHCRSRLLRNTNQQLDSGVQKLHLATMQLKRVSGKFDHEITGKYDE